MTRETTLLIKLAQVRKELDELASQTTALERAVEQLRSLMCRYKEAATKTEQIQILAQIAALKRQQLTN